MFTGNFNDFVKIIENSAIEIYFQVFIGDFNDFKKYSQFKDWKVFSNFHWCFWICHDIQLCDFRMMEYVGMVVYQVLVFFLVFNVYPNLFEDFRAAVCNFAQGFQLELIVTWGFFMQNLLKTRNYPEVGFERNLRSIPVENLEQKIEKTSNKTGIVLISDGFCRFVFLVFWTFGFLDFWFPMFIDLLASSLIFLGPQGWIFWGFRFIFFVAI